MDPEVYEEVKATTPLLGVSDDPEEAMQRKPSELHLKEILHDAKNEHNF
jgi:hypothetical protein